MSTRSLTQTKPTLKPSFTPVSTGLLQRKCACGNSASLTEKCTECENKRLSLQRRANNQAEPDEVPPIVHEVLRSPSQKIQPKLKVGQPNDYFEQEADRIADEVMRMPEPSVERPVDSEEEEEEMVQRKAIANQVTPLEQLQESSEVPPTVHEVLRSSGQPLDPATRAFMEPRFGYDFSQVRVHSGAAAEQSVRDLSARAYTVGQNIVFGARQFAPESTEGRRLLAHELTHVVQQGGADYTVVPDTESETGDSGLHKREMSADETVGDISRPATPKLSSGLRLQRAACPCCTDSIGISNINRIDTPSRMGHSFDVSLNLSYPMSGPSGSCTLEWWEKTNVPYTPGMRANTWTDMFALLPNSPTLAPWVNRAESCGSSSPVTITDPPSLGRRPGRTVTRTLEFRIVINSMPPTSEGGCAAASQQITAKQVLTMVSGAPDWAASSFTTP